MIDLLLVCSNCGYEVAAKDIFCSNCGTSIQSITISTEKISEAANNQTVKISPFSQTPLFKKLEYYRNKVLNIDTRNRSILLRTIRDRWCFDLVGIGSASKILENAITDRRPVCIVPDSDRLRSTEKERTRLQNLYRNITQIRRETGRQEVYLGFPFLVGHVTEQLYVRGPLILFPVSIVYTQESKPFGWYIVFSEDKDPILNRALLEALKSENGPRLPDSFTDDLENLINRIQELKGNRRENIELLFLDGLINILRENSFPIDYNCKIDRIQILNTINVSKGAIKRISIDGEKSWVDNETLHLVNHKIIGIFAQGENAIYSEYEELIKKSRNGEDLGTIRKLLQPDVSANDYTLSEDDKYKEYESIKLDDIPTDKLNLAVASDASQDSVVLASQSSDFIVVRGPPGTGKSQVIVNLISNALAKRQKVLLVCEKEQALKVVYQRLDKLGLSRFVAYLSDAKDRSLLYNKLGRILESDVLADSVNLINQKFSHYSHEIDRLVEKQSKIINALKEEDIFGVSINKIYALAESNYVPRLNLSSVGSELKYHAVTQLLEKIRNLEDSCKKFDSPESAWIYRKDFSNINYSDKFAIQKLIDKIIDLSKKKDAILVTSFSDQKTLISCLDTLSKSGSSGRSIFQRFLTGGGKERFARDTAKRILGQLHITFDNEFINDLGGRANLGLELWNTFNEFSSFVNEDEIEKLVKELLEDRYSSVQSKLLKMREALDDFDELQAYDRKKAELTSREREILKQCITKLRNEIGWDEILRQEFYSYWIAFIEDKHSDLKGQPFEAYLQNRDQLSILIKEHQKIVVQKIISQIDSSIIRPGTSAKTNRPYKAQYDQWNSLLDELNKRKRILPIRKLIESYEPIILRVAPCWLVTPSVVSSIFPLKRNLFDYVIFDEASQATVQESLPSLQRGKNIVIIGDEKQLPPVDRFKTKQDDEENDDEDIDRMLTSDSILSLANRTFNHSYLTWHYRSNYQELIDFSNHAFYNERLKIAPNILRNANPIKWISCNNGSWIERRNKPEAILVVEELKNILLQNKMDGINRSVGVITFNLLQQEEIEDEIFRRRQTDREFQELYSTADNEKDSKVELPFVRNIERVQGEERDIVIFSLGYAKDLVNPEDTWSVQFGSLNQRDGEKYLNVAITRARHEIIIVCSFDPFRINTERADREGREGPKKLKEYLCYAKSINESSLQQIKNKTSSIDINKPVSEELSLEKSIQNELQKMGYKVDLQVGHSKYRIDLAVAHPDVPSRYILAIECDGRSFLFTESTKERDITRQEFLESKGWAVERIWSRNWWRDSKKEINRIQQKIEELRKIKIPFSADLSTKQILFNSENQIGKQYSESEDRVYEELIKKGESDTVELKASFRYDIKLRQSNPKVLEKIIAKTVAAFMNGEGGTLFIGVDDQGKILGLNDDYQTLKKEKQNSDEFEIELRQSVEKYTKNKIANECIELKFHLIEEKEICEVIVDPGSKPVFIYDEGGKQECYVRVGNSSRPYNLDEFYEYCKRRFK